MFYLSKRAFRPPDKIVNQIWEWVLPRYASLVYLNTKDIRIKEAAGKDCDFLPKTDYETELELDSIDSKVKIILTISEEYSGKFNPYEIEIAFKPIYLTPSISNYEVYKKTIYRNIQHEAIHLKQYVLRKTHPSAGLPSKNISDPAFTPEGQHILFPEIQKKHDLRDEEFYTILSDAKSELQFLLEKWPDLANSIFKQYVGLTPSYRKPSYAQSALLRWKTLEPLKWRKAAKELYKGVQYV